MRKKTEQVTGGQVRITAGRVDSFQCPDDKSQAFLWDSEATGLGLRATPTGRKTYVFQSRLGTGSLRMTIGTVKDWDISKARQEARRLQAMIDAGRDPRQVKAETIAADVAKRGAVKLAQTPALEIWQAYIEARAPRWSERHKADHEAMSRAGGELRSARGRRLGRADVKQPGMLYGLLQSPLAALNRDTVAAWAEREAQTRPARVRLALSLLNAFLVWCGDNPQYRGQVHTDACIRLKRELPKPQIKDDCLQKEQVKPWFDAVGKLPNRVQSVYLQVLLLTGCRRNELAPLQWADVDFQWNSLTIRDKVEGERTIPLTPYVKSLLLSIKPAPVHTIRGSAQPAGSPWVFAANSQAGYIQAPTRAHDKALQAVGLPPLSLHGLRRSFGTLSEWVECPAGVVAQIQGHKPSAIAEKHYRRRPLDLLRMWHTKIEVWILEQAGIRPESEAQRPFAVTG